MEFAKLSHAQNTPGDNWMANVDQTIVILTRETSNILPPVVFNKVIAPDVLKMRIPPSQISTTTMLELHVLESLAHTTTSLLLVGNVYHVQLVSKLISPNHNAFQLYAQAEITFQPQTINNLDNNKLAVAYLVKTIPTQQLIEDHALLKLAHLVNTVITLDNANNVQEVHHTCKPQMVSHVFKSNAHQLTNTLTIMEIAHHVEHTRLLISKEVDVLHQHAMIDKLWQLVVN